MNGIGAIGGLIGGAFSPGRKGNVGGSMFGGERTLLKDMLQGAGSGGDEQFASDAKKSKALRAYFAESQPELKDKVQAMSLADLEGHALKYADDQRKAREQAEAEDRQMRRQMLAEQMASMRAARDDRNRQTQANQAFGRYAQAPAAQERWQGALAGGPTQAGAALLNQPLRAPTTSEALRAYFQSSAQTGAAPDMANLGGLLAQEASGRQFPNVEVRNLGGNQVYLGDDGRWQLGPGAASQPGSGTVAPEKERLVRVTTRDANGNTATENLTPEEYRARQASDPKVVAAKAQAESNHAKLLAELATHQRNLGAKDNRYGLANMFSRDNRVAAIQAELAKLEAMHPELRARRTASPDNSSDPLGLGL